MAAVAALRTAPAAAVEPGQPAPQVRLDIPGAPNLDALKGQASPRQVASKRGKKVADIVGRRNDGASGEGAVEA